MADGSALERLVKYAQYKYVQRIDRLVPNLCALYEPTSDEYQRCLEQYNGQWPPSLKHHTPTPLCLCDIYIFFNDSP